jgi:hypothetical protein
MKQERFLLDRREHVPGGSGVWAVVDRLTGRALLKGLGWDDADLWLIRLNGRRAWLWLLKLLINKGGLRPGKAQPKHPRRGLPHEYLSKAILSRGKK